MKPSILYNCFIILASMLMGSCSIAKYLPPGDKLYTGAEIKLESSDPVSKTDRRMIEAAANEVVRPKPNKTYLGLRPRMWMFMKAGENPTGKIKTWLREKGEAPVLLSEVRPRITAETITAKIFNLGVFKGYTEYRTIEKKNSGKVLYTSYIHQPYALKELKYAISDDSLSKLIQGDKEKTFIKPGENYSLSRLKAERIRIDASLKDHGYYYFSPDFLLFKADTSGADRRITLTLTLSDSVPQSAITVYRINRVLIDQEHSLEEDVSDLKKDTVRLKDNLFLEKGSDANIRHEVILRSVYLKKNEIYSRTNHTITLNRLMTMGNFKFIQVKFTDSDTLAKGFLDVTILMTPMTRHAFRAEFEVVSKSNNYTGPRLNLSILNRNTFKGAELMSINMAGSFETQSGGDKKNLFSYSWNPQIELFLPMLLVPFRPTSKTSMYVPKTRFLLSYNYLKRVDYFDMRTLQFIFGYKWKKDIRQEHEFNPVNVSYTSIGSKSTAFTDLLATNPYLAKSYEEQFITGGNYSYTYNEQVIPGKKVQYFLHLSTELGGNALSLATRIGGQKSSGDNPARIAGSVFSQYARISIDSRGYYNFINKNKLALRIFTGIAKPYGNSTTLPYTKQFFSGGPNSLRAFQINSLGPGTYHQNENNTGFLQLGGDVKLEMNAEYRFNIYKFFKGALFVDAGNIWLLKSNPSDLGSAFSFSGFAGDLAVGAGLGLRIDVSFFILRFDLAMPIRKPWLDENRRWVVDQISFRDPVWRKENLIFNLAIGYPF